MPLVTLRRGEILGIAFTAAVFLAVVFAWLNYPGFIAAFTMKTYWGRDWDCQYVPKSEAVCVKRTEKPAD